MKFSYSKISCFKTCPYQYKLRYVDKLKVIQDLEANNPLCLGTALHTGLETTIKKALEQYFSNYPIIDDLQINEAIKLQYIIAKGKQAIPDGLFEFRLDSDEFIGFIDLLAPKGNNHFDLLDFKYSNNVESYLQSAQLHIYKYYFELNNPQSVIDNLYYVFLPKIQIRQKKTEDLYQFRKRLCEELNKAEVAVIKVDYDFEKVKEYLETVEQVKTATEFPKNETRLCPWCEFEPYCKRKDDSMIILPENKRRDITKREKNKIWIYGQSFSGKTTLANQFPDPLMLNTDSNVFNVDAPYLLINDIVEKDGRIENRTLGWEVFLEALATLEAKDNTFKTIVVDLVEDLYELCRSYTFKKFGIEHESDSGFGKGFDLVSKEFFDAMKRLTNMNYENIILISKEDSSTNITKKTSENITRIKPDIREKVARKLEGMVDVVVRTQVDNDNYLLSFKSDEFVFGGGRLKIKGQVIKNDYNELMKILNGDKQPETKPTSRI